MNRSRFSLSDRVAVVSGAAQGLGRATALALAQHGAHTVLVDRNLAGAEAAAAEIQSLGRETLGRIADWPTGTAENPPVSSSRMSSSMAAPLRCNALWLRRFRVPCA